MDVSPSSTIALLLAQDDLVVLAAMGVVAVIAGLLWLRSPSGQAHARIPYRRAIREHAKSAGWTLPPEPRLLLLSNLAALGWLLTCIGFFLNGRPWLAVLLASPLLYFMHRMIMREAVGLDELRERHGFEGKRSAFHGEIDGRAFEYGAHSEVSAFRDDATGNYRVTDTAGMRLLLEHPTRHSLTHGKDGRLRTSLDLDSDEGREVERRLAIYGPDARLTLVDEQVLCFNKGLYENAADLDHALQLLVGLARLLEEPAAAVSSDAETA
ncbi:MAG: hypothetical protein AAF533_00160 [Acidobacteriota bacterium]